MNSKETMDAPELAQTSSRKSDPSNSSPTTETMKPMESSTQEVIGHQMLMTDPDNPHNWPTLTKIYVSSVSVAFAFVVAFGLTAYTAGISGIKSQFDISMTLAILGFSMYFVGIAFAPIITPHLSELFGRRPVYCASLPIFSLFILGAGLSKTYASVVICRFFAGFFGGPCLVLIEGTFADVWHADVTVSYYAVLTLASYVGAACGPLIGGFVFAAKGWRWLDWVTLMLALAAYLLGIGMPETYERIIVVRRAKRLGRPAPRIAKAASGVTISEMANVTVVKPLIMLFTEPIVFGISLYLAYNFAVIFSFFISIPVALNGLYNFTIKQVGLAFIAAIIGSLAAAATSIIMDRLIYPRLLKKSQDGHVQIEYRMYPAMVGQFGITVSLFWIAWTAKPATNWAVPVVGTAVYVWGNMSVLISFISYLFDAYTRVGTLAGLTAAASLRLLFAAALPLGILQMFMKLTGAWALSTLGFISAVFLPIPFIFFLFGAKLRARSKYSPKMASKGMDSSGMHV